MCGLFRLTRTTKPHKSNTGQRWKPCLEALEDRSVPSAVLSFSTVQEEEPKDSNSATIGWAFTPTQDLTVTKVGVYDLGGDGLLQSHQLGIWNASGALVLQTTVSGGDYADNFWYVGVSPVVLQSGQPYLIGATYPGLGPDKITGSPVGLTTDGITLQGSRYQLGNGLLQPTTVGGSNVPAYLGPNLQFEPAQQPDLIASSLTWNLPSGGLDLRYEVRDAPLTQATTAKLYWAAGGSILAEAYSIPVSSAVGSYIQHVPASALSAPPTQTTRLLFVLDPTSPSLPNGTIAESHEENNVVATTLYALKDPSVVVSPNIATRVDLIAAEYVRLTQKVFVVTEGLRTPAEMAQIFLPRLRTQQGRAREMRFYNHDLLRQVIDAYDSVRTDSERLAAMTAVIQQQVTSGRYISPHLSGQAIDIRSSGLGAVEIGPLLIALWRVDHHVKVVNETWRTDGPHWHLFFR